MLCSRRGTGRDQCESVMLGPASCYLAGQPVLYSPAFPLHTIYTIQLLWAGHSYTSILATQYTVPVGWTLLHLYPRHTIYSCCGLDTPTPLSSPHNIQLLWAGHSYTSILSSHNIHQYKVAVGWKILHLCPTFRLHSSLKIPPQTS